MNMQTRYDKSDIRNEKLRCDVMRLTESERPVTTSCRSHDHNIPASFLTFAVIANFKYSGRKYIAKVGRGWRVDYWNILVSNVGQCPACKCCTGINVN